MFYFDWIDIAIRLAAATLCGGLIGFEREKKGRDAGFRTHILVAVGACIFALIEQETAFTVLRMAASDENTANVITFSVHRITAQVVSGIGFLGAGTIMMTKRSIKGLTTAASIWVCASLGIATGMGYYIVAISGTLVILLTLVVIKRMFSFPHIRKLSVYCEGEGDCTDTIRAFLRKGQIKILGVECKASMEEGKISNVIDFYVDGQSIRHVPEFLKTVNELGHFRQITIQDMGEDH